MTFHTETSKKLISLYSLFRTLISEEERNCTDFNNTRLVFLKVSNHWVTITLDRRGAGTVNFNLAVQYQYKAS